MSIKRTGETLVNIRFDLPTNTDYIKYVVKHYITKKKMQKYLIELVQCKGRRTTKLSYKIMKIPYTFHSSLDRASPPKIVTFIHLFPSLQYKM